MKRDGVILKKKKFGKQKVQVSVEKHQRVQSQRRQGKPWQEGQLGYVVTLQFQREKHWLMNKGRSWQNSSISEIIYYSVYLISQVAKDTREYNLPP